MNVPRSTSIGTAAVLVILAPGAMVADAAASDAEIQEVVVTGILASLQDSLDIQRKRRGHRKAA